MKQLWKRLLAGSMAICMAGMCVVTSFAASEEDIVLETVFGTSDDYEIAAQAVESLLDEEEEEEEAETDEEEAAKEDESPAEEGTQEDDEQEDPEESENPEESEEPTTYAAIAWLTGDGTYQESVSYTYIGEAICPDYQVTVDGETLDTAALTEQWFADEEYTEQATELTFTDCGTFYLQLTDAEGAVVARGSYAITPAEQEITGVDTTSYSLSCKSTFRLSPAAQGELSYQSSDTSVVKVTSAGKCTVVGAGTATITITAAATQNYKEATAEVTVTGTRIKQTITLTKTSYTKKYSSGGTFSLGASTSGDGK
ncbi:MAG: Ig-like domain-containing protein, partial [Clostridiales bacterium]|nr:Ig-like domain-containing protein [Clostridiales bacterium]